MTNLDRRDFLRVGTAAAAGLAGLLMPEVMEAVAPSLKIIESVSPKRRTRANRLSTDYILLHTTEAPSKNSLNSLTRWGEANYMVDTNGDVYRIMKPNQISLGAGRSMWDGRTNLDNHAVNVEFVGYHTNKPTWGQIKNGAELIAELKRAYKVKDERVMPHSMVAYGRPNRWQEDSHRGRKRCGMLFAQDDLRNQLGLKNCPKVDPDVEDGRLAVADRYLQEVLYHDRQPIIRLPSRVEVVDESSERPENAVSTIKAGESAWTYAGKEFADSTTTYFLPDGRVRRGDELSKERFDFSEVEPGTRVAAGFVYGGHISRNRSAYSVVGRRWNLPSTIYRLPNGRIMTGDDVSQSSIPNGTTILFRK